MRTKYSLEDAMVLLEVLQVNDENERRLREYYQAEAERKK